MIPGNCIYLHDGTFEGLLTAVALAVKSGRPVRGIRAAGNASPGLFDSPVAVLTDPDQAARLFSYLDGVSARAARLCLEAYLSEEEDIGLHLVRLVRLCLAHGGRATVLYSDDSILRLSRLSRRVNGEAHRLCGLIRFRLLHEQLQYAPFESDCNVIGFLAGHFRGRLANRRWILHDLGRDLALYWDGQELRHIEVDPEFSERVRRDGEVPQGHLDGEELGFQQLWRTFHTAIANPHRENRRLQRRLMPRRYWKYLTETVD